MKKPVLHQSQIGTWDHCPMQYYFRYVKGRIKPPGVALIRGQGVHQAAEKDLTAKRDNGALLPDDEVTDIARDTVVSYWQQNGVRLSDDEKAQGEKAVIAETIDTAVGLAATHHGELAPVLEPVHIERPWKLELQGCPVDLQGTIDLQEPQSLRDLKTSAKSPTRTAAETSLQLTMYHLAASKLDGVQPEQVALDFLVSTKTPKIVTLRSTRDPSDWQQLLDRVAVMAQAIDAGVFVPRLPDHWICSDKWCGYWRDECPFGRRHRTGARA